MNNFPALGELVKFAFDAIGVLPCKRGENDALNDADKKRIQKRLARLADEEGIEPFSRKPFSKLMVVREHKAITTAPRSESPERHCA